MQAAARAPEKKSPEYWRHQTNVPTAVFVKLNVFAAGFKRQRTFTKT
jgi:hypothetical protein